MNIIVCIKHVPDTEARVQIAEGGKSIDTREINFVLNPYDEFAVEEALRVKESQGGEVTVICLGDESAVSTIRTALAMGADKGVLLKTGQRADDPLQTARALADELAQAPFEVLFFGKQAVDNDSGQVGLLTAEMLGIPCVSVVSELAISPGKAAGKREIEGGTESFECGLPAAITAQKGLNEPRYASLKGRMAAKSKTIDQKEVTLQEPALIIEGLSYPPSRPKGRMLGQGAEAVAELVRCLREEAKVI